MRALPVIVFGAAFACMAAETPLLPGDSDRGARVFEAEHCVQCHSINGKGGTAAPDLGKRIDRNFTPALLASTMWNHAPTMWTAMEKTGMAKPSLSPQDAADLFAFFYSRRFFDAPADAGRGKLAFENKHCADCHGITTSVAENAPPVAQWESLGHPIAIVRQMWNHAARMREAFARRNLAWPQLTTQNLGDMLVYLRNLPETRNHPAVFSFGSGQNGAEVFQSKGCANCHSGALALENRLHNQTLTGIAVEMWNHAPRMAQTPPVLSQEEMNELLSYLWLRQFISSGGDAARGQRVFAQKRCADCHAGGQNGAVRLAGRGRPLTEITIISVLWQHGPTMYQRMQQTNIAWPRFTSAQQMSDLIAYINSVQ